MKIVIVGCGRVGSELANSIAEKGHEVVVIDHNPEAFQRLGHEFRGRTIQGEVRDRSVLARAGLESAHGFASVTPLDEINLVAARIARQVYAVPNVVARVYDPAHERLFQRVGLQTVISSSWSALRIERMLTHPGIDELAQVGNGEVVIVEVKVPGHLVGKPVSTLIQGVACQPSAIVRAGKAELCQADTLLGSTDMVVLTIAEVHLATLKARLEAREV